MGDKLNSSILFILLPLSIHVSAFDVGNDPKCPCLDISVHDNTKRIHGNETCLLANVVLDKFTNEQQVFCYPETYGVGCDTHDVNMAPFCDHSNDNPTFCPRRFCYIDPEVCHLSRTSTYAKSSFFPDLYYSYEACGELDEFRDFKIASELKGRTLKAGIPALYYPDHYRLDENGEIIRFSLDVNAGVGELKGIFIDYIQNLALDGDFEVEFHPVSLGSYSERGFSAWGGCVYDVNRGVFDLCVGNFWETAFRRSMVLFSTPIFDDNYKLMVPKPKVKDNIFTQLGLIFEPFTQALWLAIVGVTFLVGIIYTILGPDRKKAHVIRPFKFTFSDMAQNMYFAWSELVQGESGDKTIAQRSLALTWSFFILITIAAYTANLAAFLGKEKVFFEYEDIEGCMKVDCLVCHEDQSALSSALDELYPFLNRKPYADVTIPVTQVMESEGCDAILVSSNYQWKLNSVFWGECENIFVGDTAISFNVAWPVSMAVAQSLSYWVSKSIQEDGFRRKFELYTPPQRCESTVSLNDSEIKVPKLKITSMTGPFLFLAVGTLFGIFLKYGCFSIGKTAVTDHTGEEIEKTGNDSDFSKQNSLNEETEMIIGNENKSVHLYA